MRLLVPRRVRYLKHTNGANWSQCQTWGTGAFFADQQVPALAGIPLCGGERTIGSSAPFRTPTTSPLLAQRNPCPVP